MSINISSVANWNTYVGDNTARNYSLQNDLTFDSTFTGNLNLQPGRVFEGNNRRIYLNNLSSFSGLFTLHSGNIDSTVRNLTVICSNLSVGNDKGIVVNGSPDLSIRGNGSLTNLSVIFKSGTLGTRCGGLVGRSARTMTLNNCYFDAGTRGTINTTNGGGLFGSNAGVSGNINIVNSWVKGILDNSTGGLVGNDSIINSISSSYMIGTANNNNGITLGNTIITSRTNVVDSGSASTTITAPSTSVDYTNINTNINLLSGKVYQINNTSVLSNTTLGSGVVNSSLTNLGTLTGLTVSGQESITNTTASTSTTTGALVVSGGVGIASNLNVGGNVNIDNNTLFVNSINNRVGLGTINPEGSLHIYNQSSSIDSSLIIENHAEAAIGSNPVSYIKFKESLGTTIYDTFGIACSFAGGGNNNKFYITSSSSNVNPQLSDVKFTMLQSGFIGIGTTNPTQTLDVNGPIKSTGLDVNGTIKSTWDYVIESTGRPSIYNPIGNLQIRSGASDGFVTINDDVNHNVILARGGGLVGIGTATPSQRLDVAGSANISGVTRITNATASTSATTGALVVSGGVGISGNIEVGGNLDMNNISVNPTYSSHTTIASMLSVARNQVASAVVGNTFIVAGGYNTSSAPQTAIDVFSWNGTTLTRTTTLTGTARAEAVAVSLGANIIIGGGFSTTGGNPINSVQYWSSASSTLFTPTGTNSTTLSVARAQFTGVSVGRFVIFAGGNSGSSASPTVSNVVDIYDSSRNFIRSSTTLSSACYWISGASIGKYALFAGGMITSSTARNTVDIYDSVLDRWSTTTLVVARGYISSTVVGKYVLFAGGLLDGGAHSNHIDVFDTSVFPFARTTLYLSSVSKIFGSVCVGNKAIFVGGWTGSGALNTFDIFDMSSSSFTRTTVTTSPSFPWTSTSIGVTIGNSAFIYGGDSGGNGFSTQSILRIDFTSTSTTKPMGLLNSTFDNTEMCNNLNIGTYDNNNNAINSINIDSTAVRVLGNLTVYDPVTDTNINTCVSPVNDISKQSDITVLNTGRNKFACVMLGEFILSAGGSNSLNTSTALNTVDTYNVITRTLSTSTALSTGRYSLAGAVANNYAVFAGGWTGSVESSALDVYQYNTSNGTITKLSTTPNSSAIPTLIQARIFAGATNYGNYVIFLGGSNQASNTFYNNVDIFNMSSNTFARSTTTLSEARGNGCALTVGKYVVYAGGYINSSSVGSQVIDVFDMENLTSGVPSRITYSTGLSVARGQMGGCVVGNYAIFGGGFSNGTTFATVDIFDVYAGTRIFTTNLSTRRFAFTGVSLENYAIFGGGFDGTNIRSEVDYIDINNSSFTVRRSLLTLSKSSTCAVKYNNIAYIIGGDAVLPTVRTNADVFQLIQNPALTVQGNVNVNNTLYVNNNVSISNFLLPSFRNATFSAVSSLAIPVNFINSSFNICEIKMRVNFNNSGISGINLTISANDNNFTALSVLEPRENFVKTDNSTATTNTGLVLNSAEGDNTSGLYYLINIEIVRGVKTGTNGPRNHFRTRSVYTWSLVGASRGDTSGYFLTQNLNNIILTVSTSTMSGTYTTINYY